MIKIIILILFTFPVFATEFTVDKLDISCGRSIECQMIKDEFQSLSRSYSSFQHLQKILKSYLLSEGIKNFKYELWHDNDKHRLSMSFVPKRIASDVSIKILSSATSKKQDILQKVTEGVKSLIKPYEYDIDLPTILPLQEGEYIDDNKIKKTIDLLKNVFMGKGYPDIEVKALQKIEADRAAVTFQCFPGRPIKVKQVAVKSENKLLRDILRKKMSSFVNGAFDVQGIKDIIDEYNLLYQELGFYMNDIKFRYKRESKYKVSIFVEVFDNGLHVFNLKGVEKVSEKNLKELLVSNVITYKKVMTKENVKQTLLTKYLEYGFLI